MSTPRSTPRIEAFDLAPGRVIGGKYVVVRKLGGGWEGEVYKIEERSTGVVRAAKLFFPHRNRRDQAVRTYAKKLEALAGCSLITQYHHSEIVRYRRVPVSCLISEYVDGELLPEFVKRQEGGRLPPYAALHLVYEMARGLEEIHARRQYHGDLHEENVLVRRRGIRFQLKLVDFFHHGPTTAARRHDDVADVARILYDVVGGRRRYASQPPEIKAICRGLRRDLIAQAFPTARRLREHLEGFAWQGDPQPEPRRARSRRRTR